MYVTNKQLFLLCFWDSNSNFAFSGVPFLDCAIVDIPIQGFVYVNVLFFFFKYFNNVNIS